MGSLTFHAGDIIYVDTQAIIYSVEQHPQYAPLMMPLWHEAQAGTVRVITSELAILETLVHPMRTGNTQLRGDYERALMGTELQLVAIDRRVLLSAAQLRAQVRSLRTPDAIHAATAMAAGCTSFITNDLGLRQVPGLAVVVLNDVAAS